MKLLAIREWQHQWDMETRGRHLYAIQSKVEAVKNRGGNRKKEIVMTRLRISHSNLNSTLHIIGKHITVFFCACGQVAETIKPVFLSCRQNEEQRKKYDGRVRNSWNNKGRNEGNTGKWGE